MKTRIKGYLQLFIMILAAEIVIAIFGLHRWIRGFIGDVLVIPLLYIGCRMLLPISVKRAVLLVLSIALLIELLQAINILSRLNIENEFLNIVLGNTFDWWDLAAYLFGGIIIILLEGRYGGEN